MALRRREAFALAGVALAAATTGFVVGPLLLRHDSDAIEAVVAARFADLAGNLHSLSEWRSKVLVLNFWATWCTPCREEIPMLMATRDKHAASGVEIVGIAIDIAGKVIDYAKEMRINYPVLIADAAGLDLMRKLGNTVGGLPYTVLIDRRGVPAKRKLGAMRQEELEAMLASLLPQAAG